MLALRIVVIAALCLPAGLEAQDAPRNPALGRLMGPIRVQLSARGVDSTLWFRGRIMNAADGCTHVQIVDGRWVGGRLLPDSAVPPTRRVSVPFRHLRRIETMPFVMGADSTAQWTAVPLDTLLHGEAPHCRR